MAKIKGIDVSYHNGNIDWEKVVNDGVKFAIIREGYRKVIDTQFLANVKGAIKNNIPVMVYHFIYTDNATIKENAESTVNNMKKAGLDITTTWIWADLEYDTWKKNGESCTKSKCSKYTLDYISALKSLGCKKIGVYMNNDYYKNYYTDEIIKGYPIWLADYNGEPDYDCVIHQYGSNGKVNGINSSRIDMDYLLDSSYLTKNVTTVTGGTNNGGNTMNESQLRQKTVDYLKQYVGISEDSSGHRAILNVFNNSGLCSRYKMTVNDAWCATSVSAAFIASGLSSIFPCVECSCGYMINLAQKAGIWVENDAYKPTIGDVIMYDWDDNGSGDCTGWADHVGIVVSCDGSTIRVIEGNMGGGTVGYRNIAVNGRYIRGFIVPKYSTVATGSTLSTPQATVGNNTGSTITAPSNGTTFNKNSKWVGVVTADELNIRKGAGTDYGTCSFSPLKNGTEVDVCDTCSNGWYYIKYNGKYGFCSNQYIKKKETTSAAPTTTTSGGLNRNPQWVGYVTADTLNVRTWAGTENPNIKSYPRLGKGNLIDVCDSVKAKNGDVWYYIRIAGKIYGFVHSDYIKRK